MVVYYLRKKNSGKKMLLGHKGTRMVKDGEDQQIQNDKLEKFRLNFSRCARCDILLL